MQWNADGIKIKSHELANRLKERSIDICVIQESKLTKRDNTPRMKGYNAILRTDRPTIWGGGLITYAKEDIVYDKVGTAFNEATEAQCVKIKLARNKWLYISNTYIPPPNSKGQTIAFHPEIIPMKEPAIVCGDFNAHSQIWDHNYPSDNRGEETLDWIIENNLSVLNNGDPTHICRQSGNGTAPDLTLASPSAHKNCDWSIDTPLSGSNHLPIIIDYHSSVRLQPVIPRAAKWKTNGVNWDNFRNAVETAVKSFRPTRNIKVRATRIIDTMTTAAKQHVGKTKPGRRTKSWMTPEVKSKIKRRNQLRKRVKMRKHIAINAPQQEREEVEVRRQEWIQACQDVVTSTNEAKTQSWRDLLEDAVIAKDDTKLWKIIKNLNGTPDNNSPNEALKHKGRVITSNKKKANIFAQHYAAVSKLNFTPKERVITRRLKKILGSPTANNLSCIQFSLEELEAAIHKMRRKGAAGPDDIPPTFLKALGPLAKKELLAIFNASFKRGILPQIWRDAIIIPLLKLGKSASDLASFRPISLTSCIVKVLERMVADRLYNIAEKSGLFNHQQAGFRKGRSCEDQILRIVQSIEDGLQNKPMQRSVIALLDFSKAYDTVWKEKLLLSMHEKGIPLKYLQWLYAFLQNRQAKVRFNNELSNPRTMRQGLPQGSVLAPILFVFYIDNLAEILPEETLNALFADDVGVQGAGDTIAEAERKVQKTVDVVSDWSKEWKLNLNATKSESSLFTTWTREAKCRAKIFIDGKMIPFNPEPRLLGVTLDRQLTFGAHTKKVCEAASSKMRMLAALSNTTWGWSKHDLLKVYNASIKSRFDYAGAAWQPWLSSSNRDTIERSQNRALRIVTGQVTKTDCGVLRREAGIPSFKTNAIRNCIRSHEKAARMPVDHPRKLALTNAQPPKNNRNSWSSRASSIRGKYNLPEGLAKRQNIELYVRDPWISPNNFAVYSTLDGVIDKNQSEATNQAASARRITSLAPDLVIYTDGSASAGTSHGGAGIVIADNNPLDPTIKETITVRGAELTCSYEEEHQAMLTACEWIGKNCSQNQSVLIMTDSKSLCDALNSKNPGVDDIIIAIATCSAKITIQWVPAHCGIPGNEAADEAAKRATTAPGPARPISYQSACAAIKRHIRDDPLKRPHHRTIYAALNRDREMEITNRKDQVDLARLRSGYHPKLQSYQNILRPDETDPTCPRCKDGEDTVDHWLQECSAASAAKMKLFGSVKLGHEILAKEPRKAIALAKVTIFGAPADESQ